MPEAQPLALLRRNIDRKPENIRRVLTDAGLRKAIFGGISNDEKKAIKAFASQNAENALKTKPKVSQIAILVPWPSTQPPSSDVLSFFFQLPVVLCRDTSSVVSPTESSSARWGISACD